jgi:ribosomal protein S18 acetylase RimI-like enzyme
VIRPARPDDLAAVAALEAELFGTDAWDLPALSAELEGRGRRFVVHDTDGEVQAYAITIVSGDLADLARIGVAPGARRRGLASAVLAELLADTGEADRMLLEVSAANTGAIDFYTRHGFEPVDVRPRYYRDGTAAVVMLRPL